MVKNILEFFVRRKLHKIEFYKPYIMTDLIKTNPDYETLRLTVFIIGAVLSVLLSVVAFFLKKQIEIQETLAKAVNNLTVAVTVLENQNRDRHPVIERRLNEHGHRLDSYENRLTKIETTCEFHHTSNKKT